METRLIQRAYKTELDPNQAQVQTFLRHAGCARYIYNWGLARKQAAYTETGKSPGCMALNKELTVLKRTECLWLCEVNTSVLQNALRSLDAAYAGFFRRVKDGKTGRGAGFPRFKSKKRGIGTCKFNGCIHVADRAVQLPTIGRVRLKERGYLPSENVRITSATVSEQAGRWFVSIQVEEEIPIVRNDGGTVGVDLGITMLATLSDGTTFPNPKGLKRHERKLKRAQRALSRKQKGGANRQKARRRVARIHQHVANIRRNTLHEVTTAITKRYGTIVIEDLHVAGMLKNHCLARAIGDAGMGEFRRQLAYKADWRGCELIVVDRFFPSSKLCARCGRKDDSLTLGQRTYRCAECGWVCDRDLNAAINLELLAGKSLDRVNASGPGCQSRHRRAVGVEGGTFVTEGGWGP